MAVSAGSPGASYDWNNGQYTHIALIGYGTCGTVYKVIGKFDETEYALKQTHYPPNGKDFERCKTEIKTIAKLENPYIIRYYTSFFGNDGKVHIVMELCERDLKSCLNEKDLTINVIRPQAVKILDQLLHAIEYIHAEGIIHRDLKPSNIFVVMSDDEVRVKIGDFGLASFADDEMTSRTGAPLYRAPEQESSDYDYKVDMYTLGIVLFEVLKKKFDSSVNWTNCIKALRRQTAATLKDFRPYEPERWEEFFALLLAQDPSIRPNARYCLDALIPFLKDTTEVVGPRQVPSPVPSPIPSSIPNLSEVHMEEKSPELKPRKYQEELARPGLNGNNAIVCAPTGSGKTIVAVMIIKHHIECLSKENRKFKVVFFANDIRLVSQQEMCLKKYLSHEINIECMSGEDKTEIPFSKLFEANDILVVTPMIVCNSLAIKSIQLNKATLMVFDECHHTDKNHPYMKIMTEYLSIKAKSENKEMPQIIGLTASIGVGTGKSHKRATNHVIKICSQLDAAILMTVRENTEELSEHCNLPTSTILNVKRKSTECGIFITEVKQLMKSIEEKVNQERDFIEQEERIKLTPPFEQGTISYSQWSKQLDDLGGRFLNERIISYATSLYVYNVSLQLYEDLRLCDAQNHIVQFFESKSSEFDNETDVWLKGMFEAAMMRIKRYTDAYGQPTNPKLQMLSDYLLSIYQTNSDSKAIVFTTTRFHTVALTEWLKQDKRLKGFVKPGRLVGAHSSDDSGGITRNDQLEMIEKFKTGDLNILFATDAAREGIDIQDCNVVVTYSHKTNLIGLVQKRGRARAKQSEYTVIAEESSQSKVREKINIIHEAMMQEAIVEVQELQEHRREEYNNMIQNIQKDVLSNAAMKERQKLISSKPTIPEQLCMLCRKCSVFVVYATALRTFHESNHTVNIDFSSKYMVKKHHQPKTFYSEVDGVSQKTEKHSKIHCKQCGIDWGVLMKVNGIDFAVIKVENFKFDMNGKVLLQKKWKAFPFEILDENIFSLSGMAPEGPTDLADACETNKTNEEMMDTDAGETKPDREDVAAVVQRYPMNRDPRGWCLILSNTDFSAARGGGSHLVDRPGASIDVEKLRGLFSWLRFKVEIFENLTKYDMNRTLLSFAHRDHTEFDCFACCILTHGSRDGVYGTDGFILDFRFIREFYNGEKCPSLRQKPKLFFLQCCRGNRKDTGYSTDGGDVGSSGGQLIDPNLRRRATDPIESDFFIGYPTPRGYVAYRETEGTSWYIDNLCSVFKQLANTEDLLSLMTIVNEKVSQEVTYDQEKQMPEPTFTLRKKLYFFDP